MDRLRFAIVGSGGMAHARAAHIAQLEGAEVTQVAARNPMTGPPLATRCNAPFTLDWRQAVESPDVDAVFVTTHNDSHAQIALAALDAGKHVFVEYPLATSVEHADALVERAARQRL